MQPDLDILRYPGYPRLKFRYTLCLGAKAKSDSDNGVIKHCRRSTSGHTMMRCVRNTEWIQLRLRDHLIKNYNERVDPMHGSAEVRQWRNRQLHGSIPSG